MFSQSAHYRTSNNAIFEAQLAAFQQLSHIAIEGAEKLVALNLAAARASADESTAAAKELLSAEDPQSFFVLAAAYAKPNADKASAFSQHINDIVTATKEEFTKVAQQQTADLSSKVSELVASVVHTNGAPAAAEAPKALARKADDSAEAKSAKGEEQAPENGKKSKREAIEE